MLSKSAVIADENSEDKPMGDVYNMAYDHTQENSYEVPGPPTYELSITKEQQLPKPKPAVSSMAELSPNRGKHSDVRSSSDERSSNLSLRTFFIIVASLIIGGVVGGAITYLVTRQSDSEGSSAKNIQSTTGQCPSSQSCPACPTSQMCPTIFDTITDFPIDCQEVMDRGNVASGEYMISPLNAEAAFPVWCDMETDGGGWTVFQRRIDGSVDFYLGWIQYFSGFGDVDSEHWLGNQKIYRITSQSHYELRIDMSDFEGNSAYAEYSIFKLEGVHTDYVLTVGGYSGDAGDSLSHHNNNPFSTKDNENDESVENCAVVYKGAWWYASTCHRSNLNGLYLEGETTSFADGVVWYAWKGYYYSLKTSVMKIRRVA